MSRILIALIRAYRFLLSPWVGGHCRFYPSCSHYGEQAIHHHGALVGSALTLWRIIRCNPWHPGGIDHVPGCEPEEQSRNCQDAVHQWSPK